MRWAGPLACLLLLAVLALQWYQISGLRRAISDLQSAESARLLEDAANDSETINLRREVGQLRDQLARLSDAAAVRPGQPAAALAAPASPDGGAAAERTPAAPSAAPMVRWAALPGSQVVIDGTSSIHDWTVKGAIIGGFCEFEPAFLNEWPVPRDWTNQVRASVQVRIPVRSLKSQVLLGASKMDEIMQEAMRMKDNPDIFYELEKIAIRERPPGSNDPVTLSTHGRLIVAGVTNAIDLDVRLDRPATNRVRFSGTKTLKMTGFNIAPPHPKLPGAEIITTGDDVNVRFEWIAGLR